MKKFTISLLSGIAVMLLIQSCKKSEAPLMPTRSDKAKTTTGMPPGFLTGTIPNGTYKILCFRTTTDPETNKYLGVVGNSTADFAKLEQRDVVGDAQRWRVTNLGNGEYEIVNLNSGKLVDLNLGQDTEGVQLQQYTALLGNPQKWIIEYQGAFGVYRIKSKVNPLKGLHVAGGSFANGAQITLNTYTGTAPMQHAGYFVFYAEPISATPYVMHTPVSTKKDYYPRVIRRSNGELLAAFTEVDNGGFWGNGVAKIYKSTNNGTSWTLLTTVNDTRSLGLFDIDLFELPVTMGSVTAGTLLMGVRSMNFLSADFIDLYRSTNGGSTWTNVSNIAIGNGWQNNVYEPHFGMDNSNRLICYYASELDSANHSQKIVYKVSTNGGTTWGASTDIIALTNKTKRPGMPRVTKMGNGQYVLAYEYVGAPIASQVYLKTSTDGVNFGTITAIGSPVAIASGQFPATSPSVVWTPEGSPNGTLIVTGQISANPFTDPVAENYISYNYTAGPWYKIPQPLPYQRPNDPNWTNGNGYSRTVARSADGKTLYHISTVGISTNVAETRFVKTPAW